MDIRHHEVDEAPSPPVPRVGRLLDLIGLALFASGAGLGLWAWRGFDGVPEFQPGLEDGAWAAVRLAEGYWRLQKVGAALMMAGIGVFVLAWWWARRARTAEGPGPSYDDL